MTRTLRIYIKGDPRGQPRARHVPVGRGKVRVISTADPKAKAYREHVIALMRREAKRQGWTTPELVSVSWMGFWGTKQKARWGRYCGKKPDRDNADKLLLDCAQEAGIVKDDKSVADGTVRKLWAKEGGWAVTFRALDKNAKPPDPEADELGALVL